MTAPTLTFVCELDMQKVESLIRDNVVGDLSALNARVLMMCSDYSSERAGAVRQLNRAGVPVVGVPLVPADAGYYFTPENVPVAEGSYQQFKAWTAEHELIWDAVGLDIEPDASFYWQIIRNPWGLAGLLAPRLLDVGRPGRARRAYEAMVDRMHADGWRVENYQMPVIADERQAGSTFLQRVLGIVDLRTDLEVWMLYNSFVRQFGPAVLWSYGPQARHRGRHHWRRPRRSRSSSDADAELGGVLPRSPPGLLVVAQCLRSLPGRMRRPGLSSPPAHV